MIYILGFYIQLYYPTTLMIHPVYTIYSLLYVYTQYMYILYTHYYMYILSISCSNTFYDEAMLAPLQMVFVNTKTTMSTLLFWLYELLMVLYSEFPTSKTSC